MATTSGLTRRRGGGGGAGTPTTEDSSPQPHSSTNSTGGGPETSYESGENGHRIAFDPRDISESAERSKQPKLTLMEEVLLLGLKDKQVCLFFSLFTRPMLTYIPPPPKKGLPLLLERQHFLRASRLHRSRARLPRPHRNAKDALPKKLPFV